MDNPEHQHPYPKVRKRRKPTAKWAYDQARRHP